MNNYDWLISRLDAFIRKYYANRVIRGTLIFLTCLLGYILLVSLSEYYLYLPVWAKVLIVSAFGLLGLSALVIWVVIPLSKMARLGKVISHEQAAGIIGRHFPEVSDKLLNILQLKRQSGEGQASRELINASIDQKAGQIAVVPITSAIDFSKNKKYLPFLLPVVLVGVFILVAAPNVFKEASARLLQPTRAFEKPAPFEFIVDNTSLQAVRNADFTLKVSVKGNALPADMWIDMNGEQVSMQADGRHSFTYTFKNITEPVRFRLFAAGFYSKPYTIQVAQKPVLKKFNVQIDYPDYTRRKDEVRNSLGDMTLPQGTRLVWAFMAEHTDKASIRMGEGQPISLLRNGAMFGYQHRFMNDTAYTFILQNRQTPTPENLSYHVKVIADQHPIIQLNQFKDSISGKQVLLNGTAGDDYGVTRVLFHYDIVNGQNTTVASKSIPLPIKPGALTTFQHYFDIQTLNLQQGQKLSYYIEAWDNDGVNGSKSARSEVMTFHMYDANQLDSAIDKNSQLINSGLSNSSQQTQKLNEEYRNMQNQMLQQGNQMDWQNQQNLQELVQKQQQLQAQMEATKKRFEEQIQQSQQKQYSEDLRDKQNELREQMDNLLNKELQEQMKKLQELMQQLNKQQAVQTMQQLEQQNKLFNMDLKRMQELMEKMEMQMRMEDLANKMEDLAKQETRLQQQTEQGSKSNQDLANEQQKIQEQLDKAMQDEMKQLEELNKKLEQPQELSDPKKNASDAKQQMQQSQQQLQQNQNSKAGQSQNNSAQNLQDMANSLRNSAGGMSPQQIEMDIRAVRQILTNLMRLSFDQEQLMNGVQTTSPASPQYLKNQQEQNRLYGNSRMIRDSLYVLSRRLFKLAATVNKETAELENNMGRAVKSLEDRNIQDAATRQQYVMMHTNNLALMLNEMLSNLMQMQSQSQSQQQGNCQKPGGAGAPKPGPSQQLSDVITQQQKLGDAMQQMQNAQQRKQGQQGQQPGQAQQGQQGQPQNGEGGQQGGQGEYGNAQQLAQMAQQQAAIRRQLQELSSLLNSKGLGNPQQLRDIQQQMDKIETDLVNRRLSSDLVARQREILTRLLQAEKSLREQEEDDKRSAKTPQEISRPIPPELQKYMQERQQLLDVYRTIPPQLKPYYRTMVSQYFQMIGSK